MTILLDIDGVMVSTAYWKKLNILEDGIPDFLNSAVDNLRRIITETGATITLSTSHRFSFTFDEWKELFKTRQLDVIISDRTLLGVSRKEEITRWVTTHPGENYVILDDDKILNDLEPEIKCKLISTDAIIGLSYDNATNAIKILKN